jgi:hypothetical protein
MSLRSTRSGGTWRSCTSGGSANPSSSTSPHAKPCAAGSSDGCGKVADQSAEHREQPEVEEVAERRAHHARRHSDEQELEREQAKDVGLCQTEATHHRAGIEMAQRESPRARQPPRPPRSSRPAAPPARGSARPARSCAAFRDARPRASRPAAALQRPDSGAVTARTAPLAGNQQAVRDPAAGRDQLGGRQIVKMCSITRGAKLMNCAPRSGSTAITRAMRNADSPSASRSPGAAPSDCSNCAVDPHLAASGNVAGGGVTGARTRRDSQRPRSGYLG